MNSINFVIIFMLISIAYSAPEGTQFFNPSPVYKSPSDSNTLMQADQPVYSAPPTSSPQAAQPTAIAVPIQPQGSPIAISDSAPSISDNYQYNSDGYSNQYTSHQGYEPGYGLQTGYEGYLVPSNYHSTALTESGDSFGPLAYLWSMMPSTNTMARVVGSGAMYLMEGVGIILAGAAAVFGICTFTPFCTLTLLGLSTRTLKEEVRSLVTPDNVSAAARFLRDAIDKYQKMQKIH